MIAPICMTHLHGYLYMRERCVQEWESVGMEAPSVAPQEWWPLRSRTAARQSFWRQTWVMPGLCSAGKGRPCS